ncbi:MAG: hypothetical protein JXX29_02735 [Deltaproteobacteria bacterium]|nr:hypothetical protein [Deltaproteobacteria bacterium]MBN2670558.1 hypothetical protein [Deltaproteobacteria bacterium]
MKQFFIAMSLMGALFTTGCQKQYIPNTEILDTDFNRDVINFCERYRHAVEDLNVGLLLSLASPRYFDNSGTPSGDDDVDKSGLEDLLNSRFSPIEDIRFEIKYRAVFEETSVIYIEYTYTMSFQYTIDGETQWKNHTGDNRLELERAENGFLVLSGM